MKEYGGYIELDTYRSLMLHDRAIALNCGRNCLAYLIEARQISKIMLPYFICDSVLNLCKQYDIAVRFYHINDRFMPENVIINDDEWLYVVNYYGQLTLDYLSGLKSKYGRVVIDNAQAYFDAPINESDTLYTCRKFFGVADGAFLYTDAVLEKELPVDESYDRMHFLLGRYERTASEFYEEYNANNHHFAKEPIKRMSRLTMNLLHAEDYGFVKQRRTDNFTSYHGLLADRNPLQLRVPEGAFAYPFFVENGSKTRKALQQKKIYIPLLWPNVLEQHTVQELEYRFADGILPLPCDQRYSAEDIYYIVENLLAVVS